MVVCVEPARGFFFRINTEPKWQTPIAIKKSEHPFLEHDSHLECGIPLDLDEYVVQQSLDGRGVIGTIHKRHVPEIIEAVAKAATLSQNDKTAITAALEKCL